MTEQSRVPAGSRVGGQFGEVHRAECGVELEPDDGMGWDGSFHAVPPLMTATQVFNFFNEHPPPDATVFKLRRLANSLAKREAESRWQTEFDRSLTEWDAQNSRPDVARRRQEVADQEHNNRREAFLASLRVTMRESGDYRYVAMDPHSAYRATVALGRWRASRLLPPAERRVIEVMDTGWTRSDGTPISHAELVSECGLDEIADTVLDPESDQRELMELLREVRRVQGLTAHSSHQTSVALQDMAYYDDPR